MSLKYMSYLTINEIPKDLPEFQKNLIQEFKELDLKVFNLWQVINGNTKITMTVPEAKMLCNQFEGMESYLYSLKRRCRYYKLISDVVCGSVNCERDS